MERHSSPYYPDVSAAEAERPGFHYYVEVAAVRLSHGVLVGEEVESMKRQEHTWKWYKVQGLEWVVQIRLWEG